MARQASPNATPKATLKNPIVPTPWNARHREKGGKEASREDIKQASREDIKQASRDDIEGDAIDPTTYVLKVID